MTKKMLIKLICMTLIFVMIFSQLANVVYAADNGNKIVDVERLEFTTIVNEENHIKIKVKMPSNIETVEVDYKKDYKQNKGVILLSYYNSGKLEHQSDPIYFELSAKDLNYNEMLKEIKELYKEQAKILEDNLKASQDKISTNSVTENSKIQASYLTTSGTGQLFISYGWAA